MGAKRQGNVSRLEKCKTNNKLSAYYRRNSDSLYGVQKELSATLENEEMESEFQKTAEVCSNITGADNSNLSMKNSNSGKSSLKEFYSLKEDSNMQSNAKWKNKQRCLTFASRGLGVLHRHLLLDIRKLLPHHKPEAKWEKKERLSDINELCEVKSCNSCIFLETRKHNLFMWCAFVPTGPTIKFEILNVHTSGELKMSGNCLLYSRPILVFDEAFDNLLHYKIIKEMFVRIWGTPRNHPKSKPFYDHVISFFIFDKNIWFRHYQVLSAAPDYLNMVDKQLLSEIGPRMVLTPIKIFNGSFGGETIWQNEFYVTSTAVRVFMKRLISKKAIIDKKKKLERKEILRKPMERDIVANDDIFGNY